MQKNKNTSTTTASVVGQAVGAALAVGVSLGIYLAYQFGHGHSVKYWAILLGTAGITFGISWAVVSKGKPTA